ncbi:BNR/Asp-box repeat protein, partial [Roseateles depolymerans]
GITWQQGTTAGIAATDLKEGSNAIQIVQIDKAGNPSAPTTVTVVKDTTAPVAPVLDVANSGTGSQTGTVVGSGTVADPIVIGSDGKVSIGAESDADWRFSTDGGVTWQPGTGTGISANDLTEGTNTIQIVQIDKAGNPSAPTTVTVVKDTTAPVAPVLDVTNSGTGAQTGTIVGSGTAADPIVIGSDGKVSIATEAGADWRYSTDGGITWQQGTTAGIAATDLKEGTNAIQVVQIDKAGNASAPTTVTVVKDTTAPVAPVLDKASSGTGSQAGTVVGTGTAADPIIVSSTGKVNIATEADANWRYSTDGGITWQQGTTAGIAATDLTEGTNTIQIVQVDRAGNASAATTVTVVKDTAAPAAAGLDLSHSSTGLEAGVVVGTGTAADPIVLGSTGWVSILADANATWRYSTDGGITWKTGVNGQITADNLNQGVNTIQIVQVDAAGNNSELSTLTVVKDTIAPAAPVVDFAASGTIDIKGFVLGKGTPTNPIEIAKTGYLKLKTEPGAEWHFSIDGGATWKVGSSEGIRMNDLVDGLNTVQVIQIDKAGNASAMGMVTVLADFTPPPNPTVDFATSATAAQEGVVLGTGKAEDPIMIDSQGKLRIAFPEAIGFGYYLNGGQFKQGPTGGLTADMFNEGLNTLEIESYDKFNNSSERVTFAIFKDTLAPIAPDLDFANTATGIQAGVVIGTGSAATPVLLNSAGKLQFSTEAGAEFKYSLDGGATWRSSADRTIASSELAEGDNTILAYQTDRLGHVSSIATVSVVKDTIAAARPTVEIVGGTGSGVEGDPWIFNNQGSLSVTTESGATWRYSVDGGVTWRVANRSDISAWDLPEGPTTVQIVQTDRAGNDSEATAVKVIKDSMAGGLVVSLTNIVGYTNDGLAIVDAKMGGQYRFGNLEDGAKVQYLVAGANRWQDLTTSDFLDVNSLQTVQGRQDYQFRQVDALGNVGPETRITIEIARPPISLSLVTNASGEAVGSGTNADPYFLAGDGRLTLTDGNEFGWRYSTDGGATWVAGSGNTLSASSFAEGTTQLLIGYVDVAGKVSSPVEFTLVKDVTAPIAPTVDVSGFTAGYVALNEAGSVNVGIEEGASWRFSIDAGKSWTAGIGNSISGSQLALGSNYIFIEQTDKAGNTSEKTPLTIIKDVSADRLGITLDGISGLDDENLPVFNSASGWVNFSHLEVGAVVQMFNSATGTWTDLGTNPYVNVQDLGLTHGAEHLAFRQVDVAGNVSENMDITFLYTPINLTTIATPSSSYSVGV